MYGHPFFVHIYIQNTVSDRRKQDLLSFRCLHRIDIIGYNSLYPRDLDEGFPNGAEPLELRMRVAVRDNSKHTFTLAVDKSGTTEFKESAEGYLDVVVRHDAGDDAGGYDSGFYVSFDLTDIAAELEGKKGINLLLPTRENGDKEIKLDLPQEK